MPYAANIEASGGSGKTRTSSLWTNLRTVQYYALDMFPYPSGKASMWVILRGIRHPMSWRATKSGDLTSTPHGIRFVWSADGAACDELGISPQKSTEEHRNLSGQFKRLGYAGWNREISRAIPSTTVNQYISPYCMNDDLPSDMFVNWCPAMGTVLANDEVIDGKSGRVGIPLSEKRCANG